MKKETTVANGIAPSPEIQILLQLLDDAYEKQAWHGPNLRGSVRRVPVAEAVWRTAPDQRNIWEITLHAAYWKYVVWRKLTGAKRGGFPRKGSDWYVRPAPDMAAEEGAVAAAWREDVALLDEMHRRLRAAVETVKAEDLHPAVSGPSTSIAALIRGVALHDVYHAGQIQQLRHLYAATRL